MDLSEEIIQGYLAQYEIPMDKPFFTQVSRFDPWKDPEGVLKVYDRVREQVDCRLVFVYNMASDDPEGVKIYNQMLKTAKNHLDRGDVLFVRGDDPILVNVMQRVSDVVIQKSIREGFGLVITEALWKGTPVVASNVGGIPTQMIDGETGYLCDPMDFDGFAEKIIVLMQDEGLRKKLGAQAKEQCYIIGVRTVVSGTVYCHHVTLRQQKIHDRVRAIILQSSDKITTNIRVELGRISDTRLKSIKCYHGAGGETYVIESALSTSLAGEVDGGIVIKFAKDLEAEVNNADRLVRHLTIRQRDWENWKKNHDLPQK